jgi:ribosomal protein S17E
MAAVNPKKIIESYPKSLTEKDWGKNKGILAKVFAKPTGITEQLKATKDTFDAVPWDKLSVDGAMPLGQAATLEKLEEVKNTILKDEIAPLKAAYLAMRDLSTFLKDKASDLGAKGTKVPDSTVKHIKEMSSEANKFSYAIAPATIGELVMKDYQDQKKAIEAMKTVRLNASKISIGYLASTIKIGSSGSVKTVSDYENYWKEHVRGLGTGLKPLIPDYPALGPLLKRAATEWSQDNKPKRDEDVPRAVTSTLELAKAMAAAIKPK